MALVFMECWDMYTDTELFVGMWFEPMLSHNALRDKEIGGMEHGNVL